MRRRDKSSSAGAKRAKGSPGLWLEDKKSRRKQLESWDRSMLLRSMEYRGYLSNHLLQGT